MPTTLLKPFCAAKVEAVSPLMDVTFLSAPPFSNAATTLSWPLTAADKRGVNPNAFLASRFALTARSFSHMSRRPSEAAVWSGVIFPLDWKFIFIPLLSLRIFSNSAGSLLIIARIIGRWIFDSRIFSSGVVIGKNYGDMKGANCENSWLVSIITPIHSKIGKIALYYRRYKLVSVLSFRPRISYRIPVY